MFVISIIHSAHILVKYYTLYMYTRTKVCFLNPGSYVVNYGFIYALHVCGGQVCLGLLHGKC